MLPRFSRSERPFPVFCCAVAVLAVSLVVPPRVSGIATAKRLDFVAPDLSGEPFSANSLAGRAVLVDFWAVWCAPCVVAFPLLNELHATRATTGVHVLGVALHSGTVEDVAAFVRERGVEYPMVIGDDDLAERFGVVGFPTYLLFAPDGTLAQRYIGKLDEVLDELRRDVAALKRDRRSPKKDVSR